MNVAINLLIHAFNCHSSDDFCLQIRRSVYQCVQSISKSLMKVAISVLIQTFYWHLSGDFCLQIRRSTCQCGPGRRWEDLQNQQASYGPERLRTEWVSSNLSRAFKHNLSMCLVNNTIIMYLSYFLDLDPQVEINIALVEKDLKKYQSLKGKRWPPVPLPFLIVCQRQPFMWAGLRPQRVKKSCRTQEESVRPYVLPWKVTKASFGPC